MSKMKRNASHTHNTHGQIRLNWCGFTSSPNRGGAHYTLNKWALADESTEQRHDDPQGTINNDNNNSTAMFDETHVTHIAVLD